MKKRPLGTLESKLVTSLASQGKDIFALAEAREVTGGSYAATRSLLAGLVEKRWILRLVPGKYLIVPLSAGEKALYSEDWFVIGKYVVKPADYYFSYYSALAIHEMISHPVNRVYISTPKRRKSMKVLGVAYQFIYKKPEKMWGMEEVWAKPTEKVKVSDVERTVIDCLENPQLCGGVGEAAQGLWAKRNELGCGKLVSYCKRLNSKAVVKRLGFLLDLFDIADEKIKRELQSLLTKSFTLLDPSLPAQGRYFSRWRIRINLNPDELKAVTRT
jgi:predicted transcriptional regulator of viral defense system